MKEFIDKFGLPAEWREHFDNIWLTSDLHLGHEKIKDFEPIREKLLKSAKFKGTPDEFLIHTWNKQVGKKDLVINLGDLHWSSYVPYADLLNGTQLLVLGNHDHKPQYYQKFPKIYPVDGVWNLNGTPSQYYVASEGKPDKLLSGFIYGRTMLSHYPIYNIRHEYNYQRRSPSRIIGRMEILLDITKDYDHIKNIHGHLHSACPEGTRDSINVCYDFNKYELKRFWSTFNDIQGF